MKPRRHQKGFSLVAVSCLMVLLALIAIGLLGLSAVELRQTAASRSMMEAKANARLGLMMALAELQENLGPDQRVSAPLSLLDGTPGSKEAEDIRQPHWVGVWKTTFPDGSPFIRRSEDDGGLRDERESSNWVARKEKLTCLVSGNESLLRFEEDFSESGEGKTVTLVGDGSIGGQRDASGNPARVEAPLVGIKATDDDSGRGAYAWWAGDLGTRANVATPDRHEDGGDENARIRRQQLAQDFSLEGFDEPEIAASLKRKLVAPGQLDLVADRKAMAEFFHDVTTESYGVLADVREGGLKRDLTAYLESNGSVSSLSGEDSRLAGLRDSDHLVGPQNATQDRLSHDVGEAKRLEKVSPDFGLLREWYRRQFVNPLDEITLGSETGETRAASPRIRTYGGHNRKPVEYFNREANDVSPVLVEGSLYYNLSYYETGQPLPDAYGLRVHYYPRVALWNPYNFELEVPPSMILLWINGGKQVEVTFDPPAEIRIASRRGGYRTIVLDRLRYDMSWGKPANSDGWGWRRGSMYFAMEGVKIGPGETVMFSPGKNAVYDETYLGNNILTASKSPDPTRGFYLDERADGIPLFNVDIPAIGLQGTDRELFVDNRIPAVPTDWREFVDTKPIGNLQEAQYTQADDFYMFWKPVEGVSGPLTLDRFCSLPHGQYVSCAYQYGDEDELPLAWNSADPVPMPQSNASGIVGVIPDRRTRDGFRLRWFDEHLSNRLGGGSLANTPHLESSAIANWNVRSSYSFRSPYENVSDMVPQYFGIYTRDLFDESIDWLTLSPGYRDGKVLGDPFNPPTEGVPKRILFDVPRRESGVVSLGDFQHVKFSEFVWHPTYAFGNSMNDPRLDLDRTEPRRDSNLNSRQGGWNKDSIGWASDGRSNSNGAGISDQENWAHHARGLLEDNVEDNTVIFDLSFELNHSLWDRFFLSTGTADEKEAFARNPGEEVLPNGRIALLPGDAEERVNELTDFHEAASAILLDGAFNVNSTSVPAWESLLLSGADEEGGAVFPRLLNAPGGSYDGGDAEDELAWSGVRKLSREEVRSLAEAIVEQVKLRGPFLSLSDFVNRKLSNDPDLGRKGALQAAIDRSGVNGSFREAYPLDNKASLPSFAHPDHIREPVRIEQTNKPDTTAWGALGFITQADLLQRIGHVLTARSDSFLIRAYGCSKDKSGKVVSEIWCEAVAQRLPEPIVPDESGLNPETEDVATDFGRRFVLRRFRWLSPTEV